MKKFIFLKPKGTIFTKGSCVEGTPLWDNPMDKNSIETLNMVINNLDLKIILLEVPDKLPYSFIAKKFSDAGFRYAESIIGQVISVSKIKVSTPYDNLGLKPFPIQMGNCIKQWVDNFIATPYKMHPEKGREFEIWNFENKDPEFKGMRVLKEKEDFDYRILGDVTGLFVEQQDKLIKCDYNYGFNFEIAKALVLSF